MTDNPLAPIAAKIADLPRLISRVGKWHADGERVVFTNGCFDILHFGHVHYLAAARALGERLVVGLNSGSSVRRLKGPTRPIQDEQTRGHLIASLYFVDAVVFFDADTPIQVIEAITPDVLVKGGDWDPSRIVGAAWVLEHGGMVRSLPFVAGYSTTALAEKIRIGGNSD